jgi:ADP-dependent NAD(P)H-hydrate dehydratase
LSAPTEINLDFLQTLPLPSLGAETDKDSRGRVLTIAGSAEVPGAAVLAGLGALRAGAGKLQMAASQPFALALAFAMPEARVITVAGTVTGDIGAAAALDLAAAAAHADAVILGPGMMDESAAGALVHALLAQAHDAAFVVDAAAMTSLTADEGGRLQGRLVLTPHAGEMAALSGKTKAEVVADPLGAARETAKALQAVVVMKGATTFVVSPDGLAWRHAHGAVGLATGGSGDVLAGVIGGLLARGAAPVTASIWGVVLHARAGARLASRLGPLGFLARELPGEIPAAMVEASPAKP